MQGGTTEVLESVGFHTGSANLPVDKPGPDKATQFAGYLFLQLLAPTSLRLASRLPDRDLLHNFPWYLSLWPPQQATCLILFRLYAVALYVSQEVYPVQNKLLLHKDTERLQEENLKTTHILPKDKDVPVLCF